ncbi:MAG: glycosyltransferase family 9 protein [bacterium]|nr:glycosyltransferase family 9 protein [bacterium]
MHEERKILIQRADKLGDVVLSLPVLESLALNLNNVKLHYLTSKTGGEFLQGHPLVDKVLIADFNDKGEFINSKQILKEIKKEKYHVYLSLWNNPSFALLGFRAGIPVRIGDSSNLLLRWCYTVTVKQDWEDYTRHQIAFNMDLLKPLGLKKKDIIRRIFTSKKANESINSFAAKMLSPSKKNILIFSGTGGSNFPIPEDVIIQFIKIVQQRKKFNVILCGPKPDEGLGLMDYKNEAVVNLTGKTTLKELISLINFADYYIGPDTGPTHIASFLGKPMICFSPIKPSPPSRWGSSSDFFKIIRKEYFCSHNSSQKCNPDKCFEYLDGRYLFNVFSELLNQISICDKFDDKTRYDYLLLNSFRVLYIVQNKSEFARSSETINALREEGLVIMPLFLHNKGWFSSLTSIIRIVLEKNINIIQGNLPFWYVWIVRFYLGTVKQYIRPVYVKQKFHRYIKLSEYLEIYQDAWH